MPIYEYRCENSHSFEVMQRITDEPVTECKQCGAPVQRVYHPVAVHFKGSGFYTTDYGRKRTGAGESSGEGGKPSEDKGSASDSKADSKSATKPERKPDSKQGSNRAD